MTLIENLDEIPESLRNGVVTIGNFDGVHLGHATLIRRMREYGDSPPVVVFTFHPHPAAVLRPENAPQPLTWINRKAKLLERLGVDAVIACPTSREMLEWSAETFFERILCEKLRARHVVEGTNFRFGRNRSGDVKKLGELCRENGMTCEMVEPVVVGGSAVSSSRIRGLISRGEIREANRLLTNPYRIRGMVVHGLARGRTLGFPTANLEAIDTLLPGHGIYAGRAIYNDRFYPAAIHVGPNTTFHEKNPKVEVHILDFQESIYGKLLKVEFLEYLRGIIAFSGRETLIMKIQEDVRRVREAFQAENGGEIIRNA